MTSGGSKGRVCTNLLFGKVCAKTCMKIKHIQPTMMPHIFQQLLPFPTGVIRHAVSIIFHACYEMDLSN